MLFDALSRTNGDAPVQIVSIEEDGEEPYFDLCVPGTNCYWAAGVWHHNSGKTTFCQHALSWLARRFPQAMFLEEPVDTNPFLIPFLADKKRWAFTMQVHLLNSRFAMHQEAAQTRRKGNAAILDRGVWGDVCFARLNRTLGNMTQDEIDSYEAMRANILEFLTYPDVVVWLNIPPEQQMERIKRRARPGEPTGYTLEYLQGLQNEYERMLHDLGRHTVIHEVQWCDYLDEAIGSQVPFVLNSALKKVRGDWTGRQGW